MVFKNLPIEFDARGQAKLRVSDRAPSSVARNGEPRLGDALGNNPFALAVDANANGGEQERLLEEAVRSPHVRYFEVEPLTRAAGQLALRAVVDLQNRRVLDARVEETGFRGIELILKNRVPSDAIPITSRVSGSASAAHSIASAMALEMAAGVVPPPLALVVRNLGAAAEVIGAHVRHLFLLAGPDYSESAVSRTSGGLWAKAQAALAPRAEAHGLRTIADLMRELNPMSGHLYREALHLTRAASEVATLVFGKYPHPSTIFVAGIGIEADREIFNQVLGRINLLVDYAKKVAAIWDDLTEFFYTADVRYRQVGQLPANLIAAGMCDDPESYDARFDHCNEWGAARLSTPGALVGEKLRTLRLTELNAGIEEFVEHTFFATTNGHRVKQDQQGVPLSPLHPWNRETTLEPTISNWKERYSWSVATRWDREPMETGPIARLWLTAIGGKLKNEFIQPLGGKDHPRGGLELALPRFQSPARKLVWDVPTTVNAFERNRARAYEIGSCAMMALTCLLRAFDCLQRGERQMSTRYKFPAEGIGVGFWESGQGMLAHYVLIARDQISNYQIVTPSAWLGSPHDPFGTPGPHEAAMTSTPLLEEFARPEDFTGIDLLRAVRSFDP